MQGIEIRTTTPKEYRVASATVSTALMHAPANDDTWAKPQLVPSWEASDSLSAWDGERCVGHVAGYRFDTLVPGGAWLPTSGVTRVGVLATHRRRGLLRAMLTRLLTEAVERGQVLASLRASDTRIYQRFGFGLAGRCAETILTSAAALPITGFADGSMRILHRSEILDTVTGIYDRVARRPGVLRRPAWMTQRYFEQPLELGGDAEFVAVHTSVDGVDDGFVHYGVKWKEERHLPPAGTGEVYDLWGADPSVELALWHYLCNVDLVREWFAEERPVDDIIHVAVTDPRSHLTKSLFDEQWLRLLDVDGALTRRGYADVGGTVTIAVNDSLLPANTGIWSLSASGAKRLADDDTTADLALDVRELAATYLGGTTFYALAGAGRVDVRTGGALAIADALFAVTEAPFCCSGF